jgi:hypothetical protein
LIVAVGFKAMKKAGAGPASLCHHRALGRV